MQVNLWINTGLYGSLGYGLPVEFISVGFKLHSGALSSIFCFVTEFLLGLLFNPDDGCNTFL
jgi:hypothetical protein